MICKDIVFTFEFFSAQNNKPIMIFNLFPNKRQISCDFALNCNKVIFEGLLHKSSCGYLGHNRLRQRKGMQCPCNISKSLVKMLHILCFHNFTNVQFFSFLGYTPNITLDWSRRILSRIKTGSWHTIQGVSLDTLCWRSDVMLQGSCASYQPRSKLNLRGGKHAWRPHGQYLT